MSQDTPLGHNRCDHCRRLSVLYEPWPTCRECGSETCPDCDDPDSYDEIDGRVAMTCGPCAFGATDPRERDDDDGRTYADPRDEMERRQRID